MSTAVELVKDLSGHGIVVRPDGERLRLRPGSAISDELLEDIRQHRAELLALLRGRCSVCLDFEQSGKVLTLICGACGWAHPKVRVLVALQDHGTVTAQQIANVTALDRRVVYAQLGRLYDLDIVATDLEGRFWLKERTHD